MPTLRTLQKHSTQSTGTACGWPVADYAKLWYTIQEEEEEEVMEGAIQSQLVAFVIKHYLPLIYQCGFQKKHSTETVTVYFVHHNYLRTNGETDDDWVYFYRH